MVSEVCQGHTPSKIGFKAWFAYVFEVNTGLSFFSVKNELLIVHGKK